MDYKEKYEMALEGIQEILSSGEDSIKMSRLQLRLQGIFPELAESKDERIRKSLLDYFANFKPDDMWDNDFLCSDILAWLEKQGEQKSAWSEEDEDMLNDAIGAVGAADFYTYDGKQEIENWLKALKQRIKL